MAGRSLLLAVVALTLIGCAIRKDLETPYNPSDKPVIDDGDDKTQGTKYCQPLANGHFDGTSIPITSGLNNDGSAWAEGGGCVLMPIREVWAVISNLQAMKFKAADSIQVQRTINPTPNFTHLYNITYYKSTIIGELDWTIQWFHGVNKGTFDAPQSVFINYSRTRGTSNIPVWNGGIVLSKVKNSVTSIEIRNVFKARQSSSSNQQSAQDALNEMVARARDSKPDWENLNEGFKDNPSDPDPPVQGDQEPISDFCVKDANGKYPAAPQLTQDTDQGVSSLSVRACIDEPIASVYAKLQNPSSTRWQNASSAKVLTPTKGTSPDTLDVAYAGDKSHSKSAWNMTWQYKATPASTKLPAEDTVTFKIDASTADFAVWSGKVTIDEVEPGVSAIQIDNSMLTNIVSESPAENKTLALDLLSKLSSH